MPLRGKRFVHVSRLACGLAKSYAQRAADNPAGRDASPRAYQKLHSVQCGSTISMDSRTPPTFPLPTSSTSRHRNRFPRAGGRIRRAGWSRAQSRPRDASTCVDSRSREQRKEDVPREDVKMLATIGDTRPCDRRAERVSMRPSRLVVRLPAEIARRISAEKPQRAAEGSDAERRPGDHQERPLAAGLRAPEAPGHAGECAGGVERVHGHVRQEI